MTKPYEEKWVFEKISGRVVCEKPDVDGSTLVQYRLSVDDADDVGLLAAQAPEMARILLALSVVSDPKGVIHKVLRAAGVMT